MGRAAGKGRDALWALWRRSPARRWTVWASAGLVLANVLLLVSHPALYPTFALIPLLAVAMVLAHRPVRRPRRLLLACWLLTMGMILLGELLLARQAAAELARAASTAVVVTLVLLLLGRFTGRVVEGFVAIQAGNLALQTTLAEVKRAEERTKRLAYHDPLTGLPNRLLFGDRLSVAAAQARRQGSTLALLFLDLDRFKLVNDSLGHAFGDRVLRAVAERLLACVRGGDTVARLGGDEFTLLLPMVEGAPGAARVAEKVLETLRAPLLVDGREFWVTPSIGIALFPDDADSPELLLRLADGAMYHAKERGRNNYQPSVTRLPVGERRCLETDLRAAMAAGQLALHYQPVVGLASGRIEAMEALLRWHHPRLGLLWPRDFLPLAEVTGVAQAIAPWVLRTACAQLAEWRRAGHDRLAAAVNVSSRQLQDPELPDQIERVLAAAGLPPAALELEVTEADAMRDLEAAVVRLHALKQVGVRIALDDFGADRSSLRSLRRVPVDAVKVHHSFLRDVETDGDAESMLDAVITMARRLRLLVSVDGVETEDQRALLRAHRADRAQGHLFGHPAPAAEVEALLQEGAQRSWRPLRATARILGWPAGAGR